jgi:hypothetical protein
MKKAIVWACAIGLVVPVLGAKDYQIKKTEDIQKTLSFPESGLDQGIVVDNIFGSITVQGYQGTEVQLQIHKTIKARNQEALERALKEVELEITSEDNIIDLYVDGPFRDRHERGERSGRRNPGYEVHYDFDIKVPLRTAISLKTVTSGDISVRDVEGNFDIRNVNGRITVDEIAGSGDAHTVNGGIKVVFRRNPGEDCSFKTINGDLDIFFTDRLSADFRLKTFNGDILSDFPVTYLPLEAAKEERKGSKYVYKSDRFVGVRAGNGGPQMKMDTLNGDILIHKR